MRPQCRQEIFTSSGITREPMLFLYRRFISVCRKQSYVYTRILNVGGCTVPVAKGAIISSHRGWHKRCHFVYKLSRDFNRPTMCINRMQRVAFDTRVYGLRVREFFRDDGRNRRAKTANRIFQSNGVEFFWKREILRGNKSCFVIDNCNLLEQSLAENQFQWKIVISNNRAW